MKAIILLVLLFTFSYTQNVVNIDSDKFKITNFKLAYINDTADNIRFEDLSSQTFIEGKNKDSLGIRVKNSWIQIKLFNTTQNKQTLFLHQDAAFRFISLEYFEVDAQNILLNKQTVKPYGTLATKQMNGADAIFEFTLDAKETKTIYIHQTTPAFHFYNFYIFSEKESIEFLIYEKVDAVLIVGLLLALIMYNLLIFISSGYKEYLYYSLYLLSSTLWIFYSYGVLAHYLHIYGASPVKFNFGIMVAPIFLALFIQNIFKTKLKYEREHKFLNSIIAFSLINVIYGLIDFNGGLELLSLSLTYALLVFLGISISICKKGNTLIKIFLFAHTFYFIFSVYSLFYYIGIVDVNYISSHGTSIGLIFEALFLSYLVSYNLKIMKAEKEQEKIKQIELKLLASTDPLTQLYNRRYFKEISETILNLARREKSESSIIMLDIDRFKDVNDTYGHQFGDEVLITLSRTLMNHQRKSDIVCRYGGEEFVILLPNTSLEDARFLAENLRKLVASIHLKPNEDTDFQFTISLGVSQVDRENEKSIENGIKRADEALYTTKSDGRNKVCTQVLKKGTHE